MAEKKRVVLKNYKFENQDKSKMIEVLPLPTIETMNQESGNLSQMNPPPHLKSNRSRGCWKKADLSCNRKKSSFLS